MKSRIHLDLLMIKLQNRFNKERTMTENHKFIVFKNETFFTVALHFLTLYSSKQFQFYTTPISRSNLKEKKNYSRKFLSQPFHQHFKSIHSLFSYFSFVFLWTFYLFLFFLYIFYSNIILDKLVSWKPYQT